MLKHRRRQPAAVRDYIANAVADDLAQLRRHRLRGHPIQYALLRLDGKAFEVGGQPLRKVPPHQTMQADINAAVLPAVKLIAEFDESGLIFAIQLPNMPEDPLKALGGSLCVRKVKVVL